MRRAVAHGIARGPTRERSEIGPTPRATDATTPPARPGGLPAEPTQALRFGRARSARSAAQSEDYVELIGDLIAAHGEARVTELAKRLGVTHPTALKCVARLEREGLVTARPHRGMTLTESGRALAERVRARHRLVVALLVAVGVPADTAEADAEGIEHYVSDGSLEAFRRFVGDPPARPAPEPRRR